MSANNNKNNQNKNQTRPNNNKWENYSTKCLFKNKNNNKKSLIIQIYNSFNQSH